jgi:hypothetical protein
VRRERRQAVSLDTQHDPWRASAFRVAHRVGLLFDSGQPLRRATCAILLPRTVIHSARQPAASMGRSA